MLLSEPPNKIMFIVSMKSVNANALAYLREVLSRKTHRHKALFYICPWCAFVYGITASIE